MNETLYKGVTVIAEAEKSLRVLMQESIESGRYDEVAALAGLAEQLAAIPNGKSVVSPALQAAPSRHGGDTQSQNPLPISTQPKAPTSFPCAERHRASPSVCTGVYV